MKKERFCAGCGKKIPLDHCALGVGDKVVCMGCEGAMIPVYRVECDGSSYCDRNVESIKLMLDEMDEDVVYTIERVQMRLTEYLRLPEFQGF